MRRNREGSDFIEQRSCRHCGASLEEGQKFCFECGTPVPQSKKCIKCGAELDSKMKFCPECGAKQEEESKPQKKKASDKALRK